MLPDVAQRQGTPGSDSAAEYLDRSQAPAELTVPAVLLNAFVIIADCKRAAAFARRPA